MEVGGVPGLLQRGRSVHANALQDLPDLHTSMMNAIRRMLPPQLGHASGSTPKVRAINTAHR